MRFRTQYSGDVKRSRILALGLSVLAAVSCMASCKKQDPVRSSGYMYVGSGDQELCPMGGVEGQWNRETHVGHISGEGAAYEHLELYLPDLRDTGRYPNVSIRNISYSDGADFTANALEGGTIHISRIDSSSVTGVFEVLLSDTRNGAETRVITGTFGITGE